MCNGCKDDTAEQVRSIDSSITVIETEIASKANALNPGDKAATSFPRLYVDADIIFLPGTTRAIIEALQGVTEVERDYFVRRVNASELAVGMTLMEDLRDDAGMLFATAGHEVTPLSLTRLRSLGRGRRIQEPIVVRMLREDRGADRRRHPDGGSPDEPS